MKINILICGLMFLMAMGSFNMEQVEVSFSKPAEEGEFTIFAYSPEKVIIIDSAAKVGYAFDTVKKTKIGSFTTEVAEPKAATWVDNDLWILDQKTETIYQVDPEKGTIIKGIPAPKPEGEGEWSYEGLTWDGEYLWVAYFAGFSSMINRVALQNGEVVQSFFADAHLRGIYSNGTNLWALCYNGPKLPPMIDKRVIAEEGFETSKTREFIGKVNVPDPRGLAFDGERFLTLDLKKGEVVSFKLQE